MQKTLVSYVQEKASTDFCLFKAKQLKGSLDAALSEAVRSHHKDGHGGADSDEEDNIPAPKQTRSCTDVCCCAFFVLNLVTICGAE